jgi:hypothetical protein
VDADRFNRIVIALRVVLRQLEELKRRYPQAARALDKGIARS